MSIRVQIGDLTCFPADVIVNAANAQLAGGGGVDGALHRAAGPKMLEECRVFRGCPTGDAVITGAFELPAQHVVHCVGPIWRGGAEGEPELLARTHQRALELARGVNATSVAFPAISCGVYGYPVELAAHVALHAVSSSLRQHAERPPEVYFICYNEPIRAAFQRALDEVEA